MKSLSFYINEQLENDNVLITEGKFWDWLKSLFSTDKGKKSKKDFDNWINSDDDAKKYNDKRKKLNDEYKDKSDKILKDIEASKKPDDIEKASQELSELTKKRSELYIKINDEYGELNKAPGSAALTIYIEYAAEQIKILNHYKQIFINWCGTWDESSVDDDVKLKNKKRILKESIDDCAKAITYFSDFCKDANDETIKEIINVFKKGKVDKYFNISGNEISLNTKEYNNLLVQEYKKQKNETA